MAQVRRLVEGGSAEIVLTGVDITDYGAGLPGDMSLGKLVRHILRQVPELERLRLSSIDQVEVACAALEPGPSVRASVILRLPDTARAAQIVFEATGGIHAAALFEPDGTLAALREDVGRHNAMDKLVGHELLAGRLPASEGIAFLSGRASFELVQKAAVAGIPIVCAVSAPSTLAIGAARRLGMTLVGFLREGRFSVYTHPERIQFGA